MTAWSFDRLRLWAENDTQPERWARSLPARDLDIPAGRVPLAASAAPPGRDVMAEAPDNLGHPGGPVTSMFERALGDGLRPVASDAPEALRRRTRLRLRLRRHAARCRRSGEGRGGRVPFLQIGRLRNILVPDQGSDVPFRIENYPYRDELGRETVTFVREYEIAGHERRFDATMIYSERLQRIVDYLGTHQHLAVDLQLEVMSDGSLHLRSDAQRFYEGPLVSFRFPMLFSGRADLHERFDDEAGVYRVSLEVRNRFFGFLFGYDGEFSCEFPAATDAPARLKPVRTEARE